MIFMVPKDVNIVDYDWQQIVLPYEELLEDLISAIKVNVQVEEKMYMRGNGYIYKVFKRGCLVQCDGGEKIFIPHRNYKGWCNTEGTRVQTNMDLKEKDFKNRDCYLDSMECVSFDELKYRMFVSLEEGDMPYAATCVWAIYDCAADEYKEKMRECIHEVRNLYRKYRKMNQKGSLNAA